MQVLYILGQDAGGLPHYTAELANAVAAHADVAVMKPEETTADDLFADDVELLNVFSSLGISVPKIYRREVNPVRALRGMVSYNRLRDLRAFDADIVHDPTDLFPQVKFFLRRHGIDTVRPVVVTRHEVERHRFSVARPHHLAEELVDAVIPDLDLRRVIVHTEHQRQALIERGTPPANIEVIPHGTYSVFGDHADLDGQTEANTVLFFGNIAPHKGIETLVRAIPLVKRDVPDVTLVIAGDGELSDASRSIIDAHPQHFDLHDYYIPNDAVRGFFDRAAVVALPYHERAGSTNGHSGVLSTARSFGKPVVASEAGDFPAQVEGEGCGTVVPSQDPQALATAITHVLQDDAVRAEMARQSKRRGAELSWESIGRRHVELYEEIHHEQPVVQH